MGYNAAQKLLLILGVCPIYISSPRMAQYLNSIDRSDDTMARKACVENFWIEWSRCI